MNLTRNNWQLGWLPSDDSINGRKNGLARMDNLQLDENGSISLTRAFNKINTSAFGGYVHSCYSKVIGSSKVRYVGLSTGQVLRSASDFSDAVEVLNSGSPDEEVAFGNTLGHVLVCSVDQRKKDDGSTVRDLGLLKPDAPIPYAVSQPFVDIVQGDTWASFILEEGSDFANNTGCVDVTSGDYGVAFRAIVKATLPSVVDSLALSISSIGTDNDTFSFGLRIGDTSYFESIRIELFLDGTGDDYYYKDWAHGEGSFFNEGTDIWTTVQCKRSEFTRAGVNPDLNWSTIYGVRITILTTAPTRCLVDTMRFYGGSKGPLNGKYKWRVVEVYNSGAALHKSPPSDESVIEEFHNGYASVTTETKTNSQANELWIYRSSAEVNIDVIPIGEEPKLDGYYRVGVVTPAPTGYNEFNDQLSDSEVLEFNIFLNINLISVQDIVDEILAIETDFAERTFYMTFKEIYVSDNLDPDSIDSSLTIKLSGSSTEKNLWLKKVSEGNLLVGTTSDIYIISGSFSIAPDGTPDIFVKGLGVDHPPICQQVAIDSEIAFYVASDGLRAFSLSDVKTLSEQLNLLFHGDTRYEIAGIALYPMAQAVYPIAVTKGKIWLSTPFKDGSRNICVYDWQNEDSGRPNYWYLYYTNPICLFAEEDGKLLGGYGSPGDYYLRELDTGTLIDGATKQAVVFQTFFDDNDQPRNRKDTFTLKLTLDTGNEPATIYVAKDSGDFVSLGTQSFNGEEEKLITIEVLVGLGFRFALKITGSFATFKIINFTIEYEPRPEQLTYFRIPNSNLGTFSRKRFTNYAFVIDTLGNNITFTPLVDNISKPTSTVNINYPRGSHVHYFTTETIGTDIGGTLSGGIFEFYGVLLEEIVSEKLPIPTKFLIIPANDYGVPNRKRHSSYKFQINTRGADVRFTPRLDGVNKDPNIANTTEKRTHEYFFSADTIAIDIGGILESIADTPFEFYGVIKPQEIEVLPARLKEYRINDNNFGIPAKKRIRTLPMVIDTGGSQVTFTPLVDGVAGTPSYITTAFKQTAFHYFITDVFGIDFGCEIIGDQPFEFYGLQKPEEVEVIPVGKKFDQVGPVVFEQIGKLIGFRVKLIPTGTRLPYTIYMQDEAIQVGYILVNSNKDQVTETIRVPKGRSGTVCRMELGVANEVFHRYWVEFDVNFGNADGRDSTVKRIKVK